MPLIKHEMTEKQLAANRRNIRLSHGPTAEGWERIRAAHLRHGFYTEAEEVAMRALGEDPAQFQQLLEGLWKEYDPTSVSEEGLVIRLARATWLTNRADRMQEGYAVRQAREVSSGRQDRLHARMMRLAITAETLERLTHSAAQEHYVTTPSDLEIMKNVQQEGMLKDLGEIAIALFYQLQAPGKEEDAVDEYEKAQRVVAQVKEIFGIGMSSAFAPPANAAPVASPPLGRQQDFRGVEIENTQRYPNITAAQWEARERPRQLLENILKRMAGVCKTQRKATLQESVQGPSPYERAAEVAPTHPNARLMRRMQDANFREVRRITKLLLKIQHQRRRFEESAATLDERIAVQENVIEPDGGAGSDAITSPVAS
jgi:hypothetical protein